MEEHEDRAKNILHLDIPLHSTRASVRSLYFNTLSSVDDFAGLCLGGRLPLARLLLLTYSSTTHHHYRVLAEQ